MARSVPLATAFAIVLCSLPAAAEATSVSGQLTPDYGPPLATQSSQTSFIDATPAFSSNPVLYADGSELDAVHGYIADGVLHLFFAGNLGFCCPTQYSHQEQLDVFVDSRSGGQHVLRSDNPSLGCCGGSALNAMAGLTFDAGFAADYWLDCTVNMAGFYAVLPATGGGAGDYLGYNVSGAPGTLSGGSNPFGVLLAVDNSNGAGVTQGCAAGSPGAVTTGVEWAIPLAAIGDPTGCVRVTAFVARGGGDLLGNQVLGPLPPGNCALGAPATVDFSAIPGDQFVTICPSATLTRVSTWGRIKTVYR